MTEIIGIIGAMDVEVENFKSAMSDIQKVTVSGMDFYSGKMFNKNVVVVKSGVGKVFAGLATEILCIKFNVNCVINTGVAGSVSGIKIGETVISSAVCQHDMDTSPLGDPVGLISGINIVSIPADKTLKEEILSCAKNLSIPAISGRIASGDQFIAKKEQKDKILKEFSPIACEMEGAAIGQVAFVNGVPFACIRAISDSFSGKNEMDYALFADRAASRGAELLLQVLKG